MTRPGPRTETVTPAREVNARVRETWPHSLVTVKSTVKRVAGVSLESKALPCEPGAPI